MLVAGEGAEAHGGVRVCVQADLVEGRRRRCVGTLVGAHMAGGKLVVGVCGIQRMARAVCDGGELERGHLVAVVVVQRRRLVLLLLGLGGGGGGGEGCVEDGVLLAQGLCEEGVAHEMVVWERATFFAPAHTRR